MIICPQYGRFADCGNPDTEILGYAAAGQQIYYGIYPGTIDVTEGHTLELTAYPIGFASYPDGSGKEVPALRFAAFSAS